MELSEYWLDVRICVRSHSAAHARELLLGGMEAWPHVSRWSQPEDADGPWSDQHTPENDAAALMDIANDMDPDSPEGMFIHGVAMRLARGDYRWKVAVS